MRYNGEIPDGGLNREPAPDWAALIERLVDSSARIARNEVLLLENRLLLSLRSAAEPLIARVIAIAVLALAGLLGVTFLLCGYIFLLHQWLPWWQAFGAGGLTTLVLGLVFFAVLNGGARRANH
ncbi:MAG: hypothetical protein ABSG46_08350 [Candidatus Binataceae bacterium]|jgi:hypothetical protein